MGRHVQVKAEAGERRQGVVKTNPCMTVGDLDGCGMAGE